MQDLTIGTHQSCNAASSRFQLAGLRIQNPTKSWRRFQQPQPDQPPSLSLGPEGSSARARAYTVELYN